jgi:adenylate cyclase
MSTLSTRNLTILLTDIKGFTDKTSRKSRSEIIEMLDRHKAVVLPVLEGKGGKLVKTIGDAFLMTFESPTDAVLAGVCVQDALRAHNEGREGDDRLDVRIAINTGEVNLADNDIFGEPVNITARIEAVAEAGEVFFTEAVYLAMNKKEVPSSEVGLLQLKGIPEKVRVYKVKREEPISNLSAAQKATDRPSTARSPKAVPFKEGPLVHVSCSLQRRALALIIDLCLCGIIVGAIFPVRRSSHRAAREKAVESALAQGASTAAKAAATGTFKIDDKGIRIDSRLGKVVVDDNGIVVGGGGRELRVDNDGVSVNDKKGTRRLAGKDDDDSEDYENDGRRWGFAWPLAWFVYSIVFIKMLGTTPGGKIAKVGLVRMDGAPLDKKDRMTRSAFSVISGYCMGLGYLWALWEKDGRGWHDLMAGTRVVRLEP